MEKLSAKTALVTGSTDRVGRLVARKLGQAGACVLVHGHDAERGARAVADIEASGGSGDFPCRRSLFTGRGASNCRSGPGDGGSARHPDQQCWNRHRWSTSDQRRRVRAALCAQLPRRISAHIAAVAAHQELCARADRERLIRRTAADRLRGRNANPGYSGARAYCQSKLAEIMFTIDLGAALKGTGVMVTCLHPATYMDTNMVRRAGVIQRRVGASGR